MKYKRFIEEQPQVDGFCWTLTPRRDPQVEYWSCRMKHFTIQGRTICDPKYWCKIEIPEPPYTREGAIEKAAKKLIGCFGDESYTLEGFEDCVKKLRDAVNVETGV